jgi:hypothetical protein
MPSTDNTEGVPLAHLRPPYLHHEVPSDLALIQDQIEALRDISLANKPPRPIKDLSAKPKLNVNIVSNLAAVETDGLITNSEPTTPHASAKLATIGLEVNPSGKVNMGFNCIKTFTVSNNFNADTCYWQLYFKNLATGEFDKVQFMGGSVTKTTHKHTVEFDIDYSTYYSAAYVSASVILGGQNGLATFKVFCSGWNYAIPILNSGISSLPGPQCFSDEIVLDFNAAHCIIISSIALSTGSIKGGSNGTQPVMTVHISAPAPPQGLTVELSVSNSNLGNIMGNPSFTIPAGQTSGSVSWFLGTRKVYTTGKSFSIIAKLLFPDGTHSPAASALMKLTK